jgi:hypothetical protein
MTWNGLTASDVAAATRGVIVVAHAKTPIRIKAVAAMIVVIFDLHRLDQKQRAAV